MDPEQDQNAPFQLIPLTPDQHPVSTPPRRTTELPFFYLTKKKDLLQQNIVYESVDEAGQQIRWVVRPNRDPEIGVPGIDAHEVWHRLFIPTVEKYRSETNRVPSMVPLGGVRAALRMLDWGTGGHQARRLLRALNQIGAAWCEADFFVWITDRAGQTKLLPIKGKFSRLSIYAIGEKHLTEEDRHGKFDFDFDLDATVYLQLHPLEVSIQESLERRHIDNQYMFSIEPTARNWLDIMSGKIFGVVKNNGSHCEIRYSWYVKQHHTLKRHHTRNRITGQMNDVVADHIASGYILKPEYHILKKPGQEIDCLIRYRPGPMASASTERIRRCLKNRDADQPERRPRQRRLPLRAPQGDAAEPQVEIVHCQHAASLTKHGLTEADARKVLSGLPADYPLADVVEYIDQEISRPNTSIKNPPGFILDQLQRRARPPATFTPSRALKARQEAELAQQQAIQDAEEARAQEEIENDARLERLKIAEPARYQALFDQAKAEVFALPFMAGKRYSSIHDSAIRGLIKKYLTSVS